MTKYAFITQDLNNEQLKGVTDVIRAALPEVGWARHKIIAEDFLPIYNEQAHSVHELILEMAATGNPPKEDHDATSNSG